MWRRKPKSLDRGLVETVARSAVVLSRKRLGGCVVLVREDDIHSHLHHESIPWDAALFDGLIEALCAWSENAIGAIVVSRDGRVTHRQAFLPFSELHDAEMPRTWGSRHLSALTLTERCDAIAVVVSEESGDTTVFRNAAWITTPLPKTADEQSWSEMRSRVFETIAGPSVG
jgi:DNA integrity scanning protein DisA with diadenylate cyclase activity